MSLPKINLKNIIKNSFPAHGGGLPKLNTYNSGILRQTTVDDQNAIFGKSANGAGVIGRSEGDAGVYGGSKDLMGVIGASENGEGVCGVSTNGTGVNGASENGVGVYGRSGGKSMAGVMGESNQFDGVYGISHDPTHAGVSGHNFDENGKQNHNGLAGWFGGKVVVTGDIEVLGDIQLQGADYAEDFDVADLTTVEPGTVMVLDNNGSICMCNQAYDHRVAGIVSGAGNFKPAIILDRQNTNAPRVPLALMGKVYCKVDASSGPIEIGDLLTTSATPGYAMKAADQTRSFGSVIGKALNSLTAGKGLVPVLVALQ